MLTLPHVVRWDYCVTDASLLDTEIMGVVPVSEFVPGANLHPYLKEHSIRLCYAKGGT